MFANWPYRKKNKLAPLFHEEGGFTTWKKAPTEEGLLASYRDWETGALSSSGISFQRDGWGLAPSARRLEVATLIRFLRSFTSPSDEKKHSQWKFT